MNNIKKREITREDMEKIANKVGSLVIKNGLSYNQIKKLFDVILEGLKDVPYQSQDVLEG